MKISTVLVSGLYPPTTTRCRASWVGAGPGTKAMARSPSCSVSEAQTTRAASEHRSRQGPRVRASSSEPSTTVSTVSSGGSEKSSTTGFEAYPGVPALAARWSAAHLSPMPETTRIAAALSDRYVIEREIGAGGMATVYLARDRKHDRDVALKILRADLSAVLGGERFLNEVRITARLDHPHILT